MIFYTNHPPASHRSSIPLLSLVIMERFDTNPVYQVTDQRTMHHSRSHIDPDDLSDSDDMTFSDTSSVRTMSTLQSDEVEG